MTGKKHNFDAIFHDSDSIHYTDEMPLGQRRRKGRKQKKKIDRSELNYYFEEFNNGYSGKDVVKSRYDENEIIVKDPLHGITRLSDLGFTVASTSTGFGTKIDAQSMSRKYYENIENLSTKEKHKFEQKFTVPKNPHQAEYVAALKNKHKKIVVCTGPAGTGKTLFATEYGVRQFLTGQVEKLIFTRPSVSVDEDLGYLPGTLEDKMAPWIRPIYDILYTFLTPAEVTSLIEEKLIEIAPLGYMRGRTFKNAWIVADEMQNSTISQMKMLLTRLGENSRIIVTGDLEQFDRPDDLNGLDDFLSKLRGKRSDSISSFEFDREDIQREDVVKEVLEIYAAYEIPVSYKTGTASDIDTFCDNV
jgi:phosphate starvation-inducible PhoH-like protein